ncbi:hypothetical protein ACIQVO_25215 [Streptomyces sp. NPDC101062]|uniref:hypothetical protein n=1 Tax=unclassified Streptomyces TaxID=2593676 RepID=UPI003811F61E
MPSDASRPPQASPSPQESPPHEPLPPPDSPEPADPSLDLPGLLARLHDRLERHRPEDLLLVTRDELGEREIKAYADGWRDAVAAYESERERAGTRPSPPRLRLVHRGNAEPPPPKAPPKTPAKPSPKSSSKPLPRDDVPPEPSAGAGASAAEPSTAPEPPPGADVSRSATAGLVPKNPSSRVPTIPRLGSPRSLGKRVRRGPAGEPPRSHDQPREQPRERDPEGPSPARPDG